MKKIKLTQGKTALVDDGDFEYINQWKWAASKKKRTFYAYRAFKKDGKQTLVLMHRLILGLSDMRVQIDHKDRNGLNNQRENLRLATPSENNANRNSKKKSASKYRGVSRSSPSKRWRVQLGKEGKVISIGYFDTEK